jgi:hypothetical protein
VGMMRLRAGRERAEKELGPRFDAQALKAFHDEVLRGGVWCLLRTYPRVSIQASICSSRISSGMPPPRNTSS